MGPPAGQAARRPAARSPIPPPRAVDLKGHGSLAWPSSRAGCQASRPVATRPRNDGAGHNPPMLDAGQLGASRHTSHRKCPQCRFGQRRGESSRRGISRYAAMPAALGTPSAARSRCVPGRNTAPAWRSTSDARARRPHQDEHHNPPPGSPAAPSGHTPPPRAQAAANHRTAGCAPSGRAGERHQLRRIQPRGHEPSPRSRPRASPATGHTGIRS